MTPARRKHLEWMREHEPVALFPVDGSGPTLQQARLIHKAGDIEEAGAEPGQRLGLMRYRLSQQGMLKLRRAEADIGRDAVEHLRMAYPAALEAVTGNAAVSLRNFINNRVKELLRAQEGERV